MKSFIRNARFGFQILTTHLRGGHIPFHVGFAVTNRCNLHCSYCPFHPLRTDDLSTENVCRIISDLAQLGTRRLSLVGGEPLIRADIGDIVDHALSLGLQCTMTTNGYLVAKKLDVVRKLSMVCVSLDGEREQNDCNRGVGAFDKAVEALHLLRDNGIPIQVAVVLTQQNIGSLQPMLDLGKKLGFAVGHNTLHAGTVLEGERPAYLASDEAYQSAFRWLMERKKAGDPILVSLQALGHVAHWDLGFHRTALGSEARKFGVKCRAGQFYCFVDASGNVYPCSFVGSAFPDPLNCLRDGTVRAVAHARVHACQACHSPFQTELNLLYSLDPRVIANVVRNYAAGGI